MLKYGRIQKKIPTRLVCGYQDTCLDCMFPGFKSPLGWDVFSVQVIYEVVKFILDSLL